MGTFADEQVLYNNNPSPTTAVGLAQMRYNQTAIRELPGASAPVTVEITDGAISPTSAFVRVDTEGQAAADELEVISPVLSDTDSLHDGMILYLQAADQDRVVTVRPTASANGIQTFDGQDVVLDATTWLMLQLRQGTWYEMRGLRLAQERAEQIFMNTAEFYVSPDGDNTNDGYTQATALATIGEAMSRVSRVCRNGATVYVAGGTYDEEVKPHNVSLVLSLQGDVTITGSLFYVDANSYVFITSETGAKLTVGGVSATEQSTIMFKNCAVEATRIYAYYGSDIYFYPDVSSVTLKPGSGESGLSATTGSIIRNEAVATSIVGSGATTAHGADSGGLTVCLSPTTITGSFTGRIFNAFNGSAMYIYGNVNCTASCSGGINCGNNSFTYVGGVTMTVSNYTGTVASADSASVVRIENSTFTFTRSGSVNAHQVSATNCSLLYFVTGTLSIQANNCASFLCCEPYGHLAFGGAGMRLVLNGSATTTVQAARNSVLTLPADAAVSGTVTGKRYAVGTGSFVLVNGKGEYRFPGNTQGTVNTAAFAYYG